MFVIGATKLERNPLLNTFRLGGIDGSSRSLCRRPGNTCSQRIKQCGGGKITYIEALSYVLLAKRLDWECKLSSCRLFHFTDPERRTRS